MLFGDLSAGLIEGLEMLFGVSSGKASHTAAFPFSAMLCLHCLVMSRGVTRSHFHFRSSEAFIIASTSNEDLNLI